MPITKRRRLHHLPKRRSGRATLGLASATFGPHQRSTRARLVLLSVNELAWRLACEGISLKLGDVSTRRGSSGRLATRAQPDAGDALDRPATKSRVRGFSSEPTLVLGQTPPGGVRSQRHFRSSTRRIGDAELSCGHSRGRGVALPATPSQDLEASGSTARVRAPVTAHAHEGDSPDPTSLWRPGKPSRSEVKLHLCAGNLDQNRRSTKVRPGRLSRSADCEEHSALGRVGTR